MDMHVKIRGIEMRNLRIGVNCGKESTEILISIGIGGHRHAATTRLRCLATVIGAAILVCRPLTEGGGANADFLRIFRLAHTGIKDMVVGASHC